MYLCMYNYNIYSCGFVLKYDVILSCVNYIIYCYMISLMYEVIGIGRGGEER